MAFHGGRQRIFGFLFFRGRCLFLIDRFFRLNRGKSLVLFPSDDGAVDQLVLLRSLDKHGSLLSQLLQNSEWRHSELVSAQSTVQLLLKLKMDIQKGVECASSTSTLATVHQKLLTSIREDLLSHEPTSVLYDSQETRKPILIRDVEVWPSHKVEVDELVDFRVIEVNVEVSLDVEVLIYLLKQLNFVVTCLNNPFVFVWNVLPGFVASHACSQANDSSDPVLDCQPPEVSQLRSTVRSFAANHEWILLLK